MEENREEIETKKINFYQEAIGKHFYDHFRPIAFKEFLFVTFSIKSKAYTLSCSQPRLESSAFAINKTVQWLQEFITWFRT